MPEPPPGSSQEEGEREGSDEEAYFAKQCRQTDEHPQEKAAAAAMYEAGDFDKEEIEECEFDEEDLMVQVDQFAWDSTNFDLNEEELPEETGSRTKDAKYVFCPPEHCLPILRLFAKHHALHPLLPE